MQLEVMMERVMESQSDGNDQAVIGYGQSVADGGTSDRRM